MAIDIIYGERVTEGVDADAKGGGLWLKAADLERVSGWAHKPEGFCKGEVCVPVPAARKDEFVRGESYNLAALAELLGQPMVADAENRAYCFGEAAAERKRILTSLDAPDFTLPDLEGRMHSLSQYRGKKVFLVSWASW
jgi:hypothetical protein